MSQRPASPLALGWLAPLSLLATTGLLLVSLADGRARSGQSWAEPLFWLGLLAIFIPITGRLLLPGPARLERIGLITALGACLYLVKVFHSPVGFTFHDEFVHWRNVQNAVSTGHLFSPSPLLPVSGDFPGLSSVTAATAQLAGIPIYPAGLIVIGVARLVAVLAIYFLYESLGGSSWVAGIAAALYAANPGFVFFDAQFSYESLALPLAALALFALARRADDKGRRYAWGAVAMLGIVAVVITHHLTSYMLATFLTIWAIASLFRRWRSPGDRGVLVAAVLAWLAAAAWLIFVAGRTVDYLFPQVNAAVRQVIGLIAGETTGRQLFHSYAGNVSPQWEQIVAYAATILILLGLPFGLFQLWRRYRWHSGALALAVVAIAYPASFVFRLTRSGAEAANRSNEFLFLGIAFVLAVGIAELWRVRRQEWRSLAVALTGAGIIFVGGVILGFAPWARLPGPYLVSADTRSVEPEGITAAQWARSSLGPDNRIVADRTNALLMLGAGGQHPVTGYATGVPTYRVVLSTKLALAERAIIRQAGLRYVVVDHRLAWALPLTGVYFERAEPDAATVTFPLDPRDFSKFDASPSVSRLFDSGDIVIYDVGGLNGAP
ncbi:MAG TPA: hypothetical protein VFR68_12665 [Candidatus Dormibacteraeota bacterium]|nr:hypothetical protein [Candidatus Dormibacteraeota bacterium]